SFHPSSLAAVKRNFLFAATSPAESQRVSSSGDILRSMRSLFLLLLCIALASAQTSLTAEQRQAILDYQLTMPKANSLISAQEELTVYIASLPNSRERGLRLATMRPADLRALLGKDAKAMAILTKNGLAA